MEAILSSTTASPSQLEDNHWAGSPFQKWLTAATTRVLCGIETSRRPFVTNNGESSTVLLELKAKRSGIWDGYETDQNYEFQGTD